MMLPIEWKLRKRIRGSTIWVSTTGASPSIELWRIADNTLYGPILSWATTNATTACAGVCSDGRNVYVLHSNAATYQFDVYRPGGQFLYTSGTFSGTSYSAARDIDWDGRNIHVFYHTTIVSLQRNLRRGLHRMDGTLLEDVQLKRNQGSWNGGCWDGNGYWVTYSTTAAGSARQITRFRMSADEAAMNEIYTYAAAGTNQKSSLASNGKDIWAVRSNNSLTMFRNPESVENPVAYAFDANKTALAFA